jgi:hypothetical protein
MLDGWSVYLGKLGKQRKTKMASLAEIRAKLAQMETKSNGNGGGRDNAIFPHWNIPEGSTARIRFLPDGNDKNDFFWVERLMIRLPFAGIKGQPGSKPQTVNVPCVEMWNETCPILTEVRTWFKDKSLEDMGKKYWKKRSYVFQGFVRDNPLTDDSTPENPIRRFVISPSIYPLIVAALKDPDIEELPTDYDRGLDFSVVKTTKGQYADYSTSKWARKESALTAVERAAIDTYGLYNLGEFLPKKPGADELKIIKEMFEASVDGQTYDAERWGNFYKPAGLGGSDDDVVTPATSAPAARPAPAPVTAAPVVEDTVPWADESEAPVATAPVSTENSASSKRMTPDEILAMIRNRKSS